MRYQRGVNVNGTSIDGPKWNGVKTKYLSFQQFCSYRFELNTELFLTEVIHLIQTTLQLDSKSITI